MTIHVSVATSIAYQVVLAYFVGIEKAEGGGCVWGRLRELDFVLFGGQSGQISPVIIHLASSNLRDIDAFTPQRFSAFSYHARKLAITMYNIISNISETIDINRVRTKDY